MIVDNIGRSLLWCRLLPVRPNEFGRLVCACVQSVWCGAMRRGMTCHTVATHRCARPLGRQDVGPWLSILEWATFSCTHSLGEPRGVLILSFC
eukprot:COSAG01_NODE_10084_length_2253_cov_2.121170_5_plen_93_part_00